MRRTPHSGEVQKPLTRHLKELVPVKNGVILCYKNSFFSFEFLKYNAFMLYFANTTFLYCIFQ